VVVLRRAPCQRVGVRTILVAIALSLLGCKAPYPHTPPNNKASTSVVADSETVYKRRGKLRFINKARPGGSPTTGRLEGRAIDDNKEPMIGMTVVLTSPALVGEQVVISDEQGKFFLENLPPGTYQTTYYYNNTSFGNPKVVIRAGVTTIEDVVDFPAGAGGGYELL
jgi:hypothetical protein